MEKDIIPDTSPRAQKLASAVYLVTSFFNDLEPVKWKLRVLAADLASLGMSVTDNFYRDQHSISLEVRNVIAEIRTLLGVSKSVALISEANHSLLDQELSKYLEMLGFPTGLKEEAGRSVLSADFFRSSTSEAKRLETKTEPEEDIYIKDIKDQPESDKGQRINEKVLFASSRKPEPKSLREFGAVSVKKNSRQSIIIGLLKRKKEIMIKDVSPLISGCSEKTIQRELLGMVKAGILKKEGEKRWSRYSLADQNQIQD